VPAIAFGERSEQLMGFNCVGIAEVYKATADACRRK
jgi:hypothetical protein